MIKINFFQDKYSTIILIWIHKITTSNSEWWDHAWMYWLNSWHHSFGPIITSACICSVWNFSSTSCSPRNKSLCSIRSAPIFKPKIDASYSTKPVSKSENLQMKYANSANFWLISKMCGLNLRTYKSEWKLVRVLEWKSASHSYTR